MLWLEIKTALRRHPFSTGALFLFETGMVMLLLFAFGVFVNSRLQISEDRYAGEVYSLVISDGENTGEMLSGLSGTVRDILLRNSSEQVIFYMTLTYGETESGTDSENDVVHFIVRISGENGGLIAVNNFDSSVLLGRAISREEENDGKKVCVVSADFQKSVGESVEFAGLEYPVIGVENSEDTLDHRLQSFTYPKTVYCPLAALPEGVSPKMLSLRYNRVLTASDLKELNECFFGVFGNRVLEYPQGISISLDTEKLCRELIAAAVLLRLLASFSAAGVCWLGVKRKQSEFKLFLSVGCKKRTLLLYELGKLLLRGTAAAVLGRLIFLSVLVPACGSTYRWFRYIFYECFRQWIPVPAAFIGILFAVCGVVTVRAVNRMPAEEAF